VAAGGLNKQIANLGVSEVTVKVQLCQCDAKVAGKVGGGAG
jgi:FixJ family two-component response regulator